MLNGVSSFRGNSLESARDLLNQPQTYSRPAAQTTVPKPKKKVGKTIGKVLAGVALVAAALALGNKTGIFSKGVERLGTEGFKGFFGKCLKGLDTAGGAIKNVAVKGFNAVKGLFHKTPAAPNA